MPHELPDLPWPANAFDPLISEEAMYAHHHLHKRYVDKLNATEEAMKAAKHASDEEAVAWAHTLGRQYAHAMAGHRLHALFWLSIAPGPRTTPSLTLHSQVVDDFGSRARLVTLASGLADTVHGSGWVVLAWCPVSRALRLLAIEDHANGLPPGLALLAALDVWEHAYSGGFNRSGWVQTFMHALADWRAISERFDRAREVAL